MSQNIADKLTLEYNDIQKEKDLGTKLLRLEELQEAINQTLAMPAARQKQTDETGDGWGLTAAISNGVASIGGPLVGGIWTAVAAAGSGMMWAGVGTAVVGTIGGIVYTCMKSEDIAFGVAKRIYDKVGRKDKKVDAKNKASYAQKIAPYIVNLNELSAMIVEDQRAILETDRALELRTSPKLEKILAVHPELMEVFNKTNGRGPQTVTAKRSNDLGPAEPAENTLSL